jgi:hypothetical protein
VVVVVAVALVDHIPAVEVPVDHSPAAEVPVDHSLAVEVPVDHSQAVVVLAAALRGLQDVVEEDSGRSRAAGVVVDSHSPVVVAHSHEVAADHIHGVPDNQAVAVANSDHVA